jgi:hypothetical protein
VTDEESDEAYETSKELIKDKRGRTQGRVAWQEQLRKNIQQLT